MNFTVSLAGVNIGISSLYGEVYELCRDYLTDKKADFTVVIEPSDIDFERQKSAAEAAHEKRPVVDFTAEYLETLAVYRKISEKILQYDTFLMHGVALAEGGKAYLFTAPSGVGKTTHTGFWLQKYPDAFIINGDKPLIRVSDGKIFVCGTPWAGKEGFSRNVMMPLNAVCTLFRGTENSVKRVPFKDVFPLIIAQSYRPSGEKEMRKTLELIKILGEKIRFYALFCNLNPDAARVAKEGIDNDE